MREAAKTQAWAGLLAASLVCTGCDVRIGAASYLWSLWILPALVAFYVYSFRTRHKLLQRFVSTAMVPRLAAGLSVQRQVIKAVLVLTGCAAAIFALAQPRWGFTWEDVHRQGVDIVVALDVSDSMLVQDAQTTGKLSRLERAKREITDLLRLMDGDRIGLVAFAGTAFIQCPLTLDYSAAQIFLDDVDTDIIPVKGTALGDAIRTAMGALKGAEHSSQAIILITDGEDHAGEAIAAAEEAKLAGIRIFAIGIGRDEGAPIPAPGGGFHRDSRGNLVMSKLDEPTLQKVAVITGGRYVRSMSGDVDLETIYKQGIKGTLQSQDLGSKRRQRWEERFQWLLAIAVLALGAEALIPERVQRKAKDAAQSKVADA